MMARGLRSCCLAAAMLSVFAPFCWADDDEYDATKLVRVFGDKNMALDQALRTSAETGQPISAKYEVDDGVVRLSVSVRSGDRFFDVIFDQKSGSVTKKQAITGGKNLKDAQAHAHAIAAAKVPLVMAVEEAVKTNTGYQAVRVVPILAAGVAPVAMVTLIRGNDVKDVSEKLE